MIGGDAIDLPAKGNLWATARGINLWKRRRILTGRRWTWGQVPWTDGAPMNVASVCGVRWFLGPVHPPKGAHFYDTYTYHVMPVPVSKNVHVKYTYNIYQITFYILHTT